MTFPPIGAPEVKVPKVTPSKVAKEATKPTVEELEDLLSRITNLVQMTAEGLSRLAAFRVPDRASERA